MKLLRKWSRILHRDIGYFFIGASLIYAISGIALNHLKDWNPSYSVKRSEFNTSVNLKKDEVDKQAVINFVDNLKLPKILPPEIF